jgi:hypothetical protein
VIAIVAAVREELLAVRRMLEQERERGYLFHAEVIGVRRRGSLFHAAK